MKAALVPVHAYAAVSTPSDFPVPLRTNITGQGRSGIQRYGYNSVICTRRFGEDGDHGPKIKGAIIDVYA